MEKLLWKVLSIITGGVGVIGVAYSLYLFWLCHLVAAAGGVARGISVASVVTMLGLGCIALVISVVCRLCCVIVSREEMFR